MLKISHAAMVFISGLVWMAVGCSLLPLGLKLLISSAYEAPFIEGQHYPILSNLALYAGGVQQAALIIIAICLMIGYAKGKHVLGKSVRRSVARILAFPNPVSITKIYSPGYYLLFGSMVLLGMSIKYFGFANDVRGAVDVAIGAALINGALIYFKLAYALRQKPIQP